MTTLPNRRPFRSPPVHFNASGAERREYNARSGSAVGCLSSWWTAPAESGSPLGRIVDPSAASEDSHRSEERQARPPDPRTPGAACVRGNSPVHRRQRPSLQPKREWVGWMAVARVQSIGMTKSMSPADSWIWTRWIADAQALPVHATTAA